MDRELRPTGSAPGDCVPSADVADHVRAVLDHECWYCDCSVHLTDPGMVACWVCEEIVRYGPLEDVLRPITGRYRSNWNARTRPRPVPVQADADSGAANPPHKQEGTQ